MKYKVAVLSDIHWLHERGEPNACQIAMNTVKSDIKNNIPLDLIITAGDNFNGDKTHHASFKAYFDDLNIPAMFAEGNHDHELYTEQEYYVDGVWKLWQTNYPYVETSLQNDVEIGATSIQVNSVVGLSASEDMYFWNEELQIGEGKKINSIDAETKTIHFNVPFAKSFPVNGTRVFQGRNKDLIYGMLRDVFGEGHSDLGPHGLSRIKIIGNCAFVTLCQETNYDNPLTINQGGYRLHTTDKALTWLENLLQSYPNYNFFIASHAIPKDCGLSF